MAMCPGRRSFGLSKRRNGKHPGAAGGIGLCFRETISLHALGIGSALTAAIRTSLTPQRLTSLITNRGMPARLSLERSELAADTSCRATRNSCADRGTGLDEKSPIDDDAVEATPDKERVMRCRASSKS